jgi:Domain of unknown function (DUF5916)/Carbohydrate family 9 binding domain-like
MRKIYTLLAIVIFSIYTQAQSANNYEVNNLSKTSETNTSENNKSEVDEVKIIPKSNGKVVLPPEKTRPMTIPKLSVPIVIDGRPDEESWKNAAVFKDFYQTNPGDNIAPSKPTEAYMMYDEKNLYIAFKCWDEKDQIRATVAKRDEVFGEDNVRMWLDTYNDQRRAYVIGFNPFGIQQDGIFTEGQGADFSVDIVMESRGVIEDWGWSVEAKIPFKSLRYAAGKGKMWGFNVARNIDRFNDEFDQWLPDDRNVSGFLIKHGKISGLDDVKFERTLEVVPSVTFSETGSRKRTIPISTLNQNGYDPVFNPGGIRDSGRFVNGGLRADLGVNLKYTLTPNITLDAAVNPDFAEIEADAPVVSANQRFPIFFEEKRPFFLEGKEIFESPLSPFYSRTIIDPDFAAKLTGKIDKTSFGFLAASDNAPGNYSEDERNDRFIRPRINEFLDKNAFFSVLRLKRDFGANNNVGFFGTARIFPKNRNFLGGFDGTFKLNPSTVMTFQVLGTHSRKFFYDSDDDRSQYRSGNGAGYYFNLDHTKDTNGWTLEMSGRSKDYRADSGFTRRTNTNNLFFANRFSTKSNPKAKLIRLNWNQFARINYNWQGRSQDALIGTNINATLQGNLFIYAEMGLGYERLFEEEFGAKRNPLRNQAGAFFGAPERSASQPYVSVNFNKTVSKQLSVYGFVGSIFNAFDFDFGGGGKFNRASPAYLAWLERFRQNPDTAGDFPGLDPGKGWQFDANIGFEYKPIDPLRFSLDYTKSRLRRNDNKEVAFDTNIFSLRSTYQFSRFVFTRLRLDYDTLTRNVSGQALFGWNPSPGTAFYVGYNDNFNYNGFSPYSGQLEPRFERNSRTFFIRMSYLFRKNV